MLWLVLMPVLVSADATPLQRVMMALTSADGYSNLEWNNMTFTERLFAHDWTKELFIAITFLAYIGTHFYGVYKNRSMVDKWMDAARPVLKEQFAEVGVSETQELIKDSSSLFTTYATGRVNIQDLLAQFHTVDRQNIVLQSVALVVPAAASMDGYRDNVTVTITPMDPTAIEPVIFAVVNKSNMQMARDENYFLSLTRTSDSDKLPPYFVFMTEHNDAVESIYTNEIKAAIEGAEDVLEYFAISDQRADAPETLSNVAPRSRVHISFKYPKSESDKTRVAAILDAGINLVDYMISKKPLKPEAARKIKTTREAEISKLKKRAEAAKLEELEAKKSEERRKAAQAVENLSEKEQKRIAKKKQEKDARKQQKRSTVRQ